MLKTFAAVCVFSLGLFLTGNARAQAIPTASTVGSLQVGAGYTIVSPDYGQKKIEGFTGFADYDFGTHLGIELDAHIADMITPTDIGENSYLIGPRYIFPLGRLQLYAKAMLGSGNFRVLETQDNQGQYNGWYLDYALGGGADIRVSHHIVIRAIDLEYQRWPNYATNGLTPLVYTFGAAYHFR